jgi:hypothetical protein
MTIRCAMVFLAALLVSHLAACGDDATPPDAALDATTSVDAAPDAAPDAPVDAAPDAPADAAPDAPADASTTAPIISGVVRADGGRQARQFSTVEVVVTGERLAGATAVILGPLTAAILAVSDTELRATVDVPSGFPPASLALTVTSPGGTTTYADAIVTTYWIVAPGASGGRGTYESPHGLCDDGLYGGGPGDRFELLAGRHVAPCYFYASGASIVGAGRDLTTIADLFGVYIGPAPGEVATISDVTFAGDATGDDIVQVVRPRAGRVVIRNVSYEGNRGLAITSRDGPSDLTLDGVRYRGPYAVETSGHVIVSDSSFDGCVTAVAALGAVVTGSTFSNCDTGFLVGVGFGAVEVRDTTFSSCGTAIRATARPWVDEDPAILVHDSVLVDTPAGLVVPSGHIRVEGTMFLDRTAPTRQSVAIEMLHGRLTVRDSVIDTPGDGVRTLGNCEMVTFLDLVDTVIDAGNVGVLHDACDSGYMVMRRNRVTGGNAAVDVDVRDSIQSTHDLGRPADPGGNELVVTSPTGYALIDRRNADTINHLTMAGSTLNGRSYAGQTVQGPAAVPPDYLVTSRDIIEF